MNSPTPASVFRPGRIFPLILASLLAPSLAGSTACGDASASLPTKPEPEPEPEPEPLEPESEPLESEPGASRTPSTAMPAMDPVTVQRLAGRVTTMLPAGPYTYVEIEGDARGIWTVVMGPMNVELGDELELAVHGARHDFHSNRLDRTFEQLFFARVLSTR